MTVGAKIVRDVPPEKVGELARGMERASFDELWIVEDCFFAGGMSQLGAVLHATDRVLVGHGVAPAPFRNPAALAMEWATLARLHPGRLHCGLGHGVPDWMRQIGGDVKSPLTLLRETVTSVQSLLNSETESLAGEYVELRDVALSFPPALVPPISLGVRGPRSLRLAGEIADGAILAEWSSPAYVAWAGTQLSEGRRMSGRSDPFRLTVFVGFCFADDGEALAATKEAARDFAMAPELHRMIWPANNQWRKPSTEHAMAEGLAIGTGEEIAAFINALADSGADALIVEPMGNPVVQLARFAEEALPLVSR